MVPLSAGQQRLWFMEKISNDLPINTIHHGLKFSGKLDIQRLHDCLALLVIRHEALRTTFIDVPLYGTGQEMPRALIAPQGRVPLDVADLRGQPDALRQADRLAYAHRTEPFDLAGGPLWRALLISETNDMHQLLLTQHHLITDAWSMVRLVKELIELYHAPSLPAQVPPAVPDYSDYVYSQRNNLQARQHQQHLSWWQEKLRDLPRLVLPIASNTLSPGHHGDAVRINISQTLTEQVRRFSQQNGCTVFVTLLSAWVCTLYRYSGQGDFGIGTLSAGRENSDFDDVQGFFVNILVLRAGITEDMNFAGLVSAMKQELLESLRRQDIEFSEIAAGFTGARNLDLNPLVQASFDFNIWPDPVEFSDFSYEWQDLVRGDAGVEGTTRFNLGLALLEKRGGIVGTLEFATDLFERGSVAQLAEQFLTLLEAATAQPATPVVYLPMRLPEEQAAPAAADFDISRPVWQLIEQAALAHPQRTALSAGDTLLSYEALVREVDRVAGCLLAQGVTPGSVVGVYLERTPLAIVSVVAIMKIGAIYLPLDVTYPAARLSYIVENAGCEAVIAGTEAGQTAEWFGGRLLVVEGKGRADGGPSVAVTSADALAYMIYTSGSTGKPKGVGVPHSCLSNLIQHYAYSMGVTQEDRMLGVTPFSFDISILEVFLPLVCGAELRLLGREQSRNAEELLRESAQVTLMQATPATWHLMSEAGWKGNPRLTALCGGEALTMSLARTLATRTRAAWNCYGPTETTIWSAAWRIDPSRGSVTIGEPIANTQLYVLDEHMQPVPEGIPGELYIGGSGVAAGYVNAPELTAERFIPSPFAGTGRLYRTGDRVRRGHDGLIEYIERIDFQLKINGYRVELSEVEAVLEQHPQISRSVVVPVTQGEGVRLVCYYIAAGEVDEWGLYDFLKGNLPAYMLPSVYRAVEAFPLSGSGKVDRSGLSAIPLNEDGMSAGESGGAGQTEEAMTALWEQILGCRITDRSRSFFELGGDSLKLLQLQKTVRSRLHREVTIAELFRYPSVRDLCSHIFGKTQSGNQFSRADYENELFMSKIDQINNYEAAEVRKELANVLKDLNQEDEL